MRTLAHPSDAAEILRRLRGVRPDSRRRWGRMSAHQMICHLCDSLLVALGERHARPASGPLQRTVVKWAALYLPVNWPPGIKTRPEIDQESGGTRPSDFDADAARLAALVERITRSPAQLHGRRHPIFGRLSPAAWLRWAYRHFDHHLRQFGA